MVALRCQIVWRQEQKLDVVVANQLQAVKESEPRTIRTKKRPFIAHPGSTIVLLAAGRRVFGLLTRVPPPHLFTQCHTHKHVLRARYHVQ